MVFFNKPTGGPDVVGGVFPWTHVAKCRSRAGAALAKGDVVMLPLAVGSTTATEIATNDSNSYVPGASNDTVFNTVVDPTAAAINSGGIFGVCLEAIADNGIGDVQFFGILEEAFTIKASGNLTSGDPLTVTTANNLDGVVASNEVVVATYLDAEGTNSTRSVKRVFLHNGLFVQAVPSGTNRFS